MSGEALYERYKDALKRGHVASLRGRLEEALTAYAEAAAIAPERSTPHTSAGTALMRRKRAADALRHYTAAITLSPRDEAALLGRAQALAALDRRPEAANAFDALAELRATNGKLADAVDAARRGLELAEGRERRRMLEELIERLRASAPGEPGRLALERALQVLDGPAVPSAPVTTAAAAVAMETGPAAAAAAAEPEPAPHVPPGAVAGEPSDAPSETEPATGRPDGDEPGPAVEAAPPAESTAEGAEPDATDATDAAPDLTTPVRAALDRDLPDALDLPDLTRRAEEAVAAGPSTEALDLLLDLAAAHRRDGRIDAALDACYVALSMRPDDVGLHLALVELYGARGWVTLASEKLDLLDRLVDLDADDGAASRVAAARAARG
jgi:tetratricopeptide (TPR) repeat protein